MLIILIDNYNNLIALNGGVILHEKLFSTLYVFRVWIVTKFFSFHNKIFEMFRFISKTFIKGGGVGNFSFG